MNASILPEKHVQGSLASTEESLQGDPITTRPTEATATSTKKHCKWKGKSKTRDRSKSAGATCSTLEASPGHPGKTPGAKMDLVQQDLELSSDGSASDNPDDIANTKDITADVTRDSSFNEGPARMESEANPSSEVPPAQPLEETAPDHPLGGSMTDPPPEVATQAQILDEVNNPVQPPDETTNLEFDRVIPNSTTMTPQPLAALPATGRAAIATTPQSSSFRDKHSRSDLTRSSGPKPLKAQIEVLSMAGLTRAITATQASSNAHADACTDVMMGLKITCSLMTGEFQQACLDVEHMVQKTLEEATAHNQAFTQVAAEDLDLWTAALRPVLESTGVSATEI